MSTTSLSGLRRICQAELLAAAPLPAPLARDPFMTAAVDLCAAARTRIECVLAPDTFDVSIRLQPHWPSDDLASQIIRQLSHDLRKFLTEPVELKLSDPANWLNNKGSARFATTLKASGLSNEQIEKLLGIPADAAKKLVHLQTELVRNLLLSIIDRDIGPSGRNLLPPEYDVWPTFKPSLRPLPRHLIWVLAGTADPSRRAEIVPRRNQALQLFFGVSDTLQMTDFSDMGSVQEQDVGVRNP